ncbi:MAG: N-6 DNA methylase [Phycisphaerales bacterium]|nr:N-6 DNA methylase [Phycisphaerales bacterium]
MARKRLPRRTLFDSLGGGAETNLYCERKDLANESSVETFFVNRMLEDLGYADGQIKTKRSIAELAVSLGRKAVNYKPDYVVTFRRKPRWVIDAKHPGEDLDKWTGQCAGYCLELNKTFRDDNPVKWFLLTNGIETRVYQWDSGEPVLTLAFSDFSHGNPNYEQLRALLSAEGITDAHSTESNTFRFERPSAQQAKALFAQCHRAIWKSEGQGRTGAFMEFTKLMFVKLWCDRELRQSEATRALLDKPGVAHLPKDAVAFSTHWIEKETHSPSPVNDILFKRLRDEIEEDIAKRKKKRIFESDEKIDMRPDTIKLVVQKLQHWDMFGIDEDLNGRLFETFLNATMRGRELGQYFTPRSVVKLVTRLADVQVGRAKTEKVIDACCGTGGFLIEVLTEMRNVVRNNSSLSKADQAQLHDRICNESIYGIDFGKNPPIARIARINMYLHGDGGSRIYYADALDKEMEVVKTEEPEVKHDQEELKRSVDGGLKFHCAVTNPPFSMTKELKNDTEARILRQYDLAKVAGTSKYRSSLRSNAMFIERYRDLLEDGGRLLTVIDDGLLASEDFGFVRDFIRQEFVIRAIISLPGDAFQRSGARAKTSVVYATKRGPKETGQPDVFVYECRHVGLDDVVLRTRASVAERKKELAAAEINEVVTAFRSYLEGKKGKWLVPADRLSGRLDAKFLRPWRAAELESTWKKSGAMAEPLESLVEPVWEPVQLVPDREYSFLKITYKGRAEPGEKSLGREVGYSQVSTAQDGDIVVSNISAVYRAICVMPPEGEQWLISKEFTILRPRKGAKVDTAYLWSVLRSAAVVAEWLSGATGVGRHRVDWDLLRKQRIPLLPYSQQKEIGDKYRKAHDLEMKIRRLKMEAQGALSPLELEGDLARDRLERAKPPK